MNNAWEEKPKKKRGPVPKFGKMVDTHVFVPEALLDWAKVQQEGFAGMVRRLLREEQARIQGQDRAAS